MATSWGTGWTKKAIVTLSSHTGSKYDQMNHATITITLTLPRFPLSSQPIPTTATTATAATPTYSNIYLSFIHQSPNHLLSLPNPSSHNQFPRSCLTRTILLLLTAPRINPCPAAICPQPISCPHRTLHARFALKQSYPIHASAHNLRLCQSLGLDGEREHDCYLFPRAGRASSGCGCVVLLLVGNPT